MSRRGMVSLAVAVGCPSLFCSVALQGATGSASLGARVRAQAAMDAALLGGQRTAEALNFAATARRAATADQANIMGLLSLAAAAEAQLHPDGARYAARAARTIQQVRGLAQAQAQYLDAARTQATQATQALGAARSLGPVQLWPAGLIAEPHWDADACLQALAPDPVIGVDLSLQVDATGWALSGRYSPAGPGAYKVAWAGAFSACLGGSVVPGLHLMAPPDETVVGVSVGEGGQVALAAVRVQATGGGETPTFVPRLAPVADAPELVAADWRAALAP